MTKCDLRFYNTADEAHTLLGHRDLLVGNSFLVLDFHHGMNIVSWFLRGVQNKFTDVSKTAVGPVFTDNELECKCAAIYRSGVSVGGVCDVQWQPM
jgi:hypothetical protein